MSYHTYEKFSDVMTDILSSGAPFGMAMWHRRAIAKLIEGMDRASVIEHANIFYSDLHSLSDLREGELVVVAELISNLDPSQPEVNAEYKIVFE